MKIEKDKVVSIDYTLTDSESEVIDSSEGGAPLSYLHGNGNLVPGLEKALEGKTTGESLKVSIPPEEGYGARDDQKMGEIPRSAFTGAPDVQPGMQFQARGPQGTQTVTVVAVENDTVIVDGNHPLAGETLNFDVTVREIRDATAEELQHGHAHGAGGHHHH
jgi:FKBP-type peptidyl-prolyl cis-trans isomerase SlyD